MLNVFGANTLPRLDFLGQRFGKLRAISEAAERKRKYICWNCECDCGGTAVVTSINLRRGSTTSCGCVKAAGPARRHGHGKVGSHSPTYVTWYSMKTRCLNANHEDYKWYGARGIQICERWMIFENFLADMGERPEGLTLEREDNDGNYEPGNCRWATSSEQAFNRRPKGSA